MDFGEFPRGAVRIMTSIGAGLAATMVSASVMAQEAAESVAEAAGEVTEAASGYTPLGPDMIKGQPTPGGIGFQDQYSPTGEYAQWMHDGILMPLITIISLFVLVLLLWVMVRYNKRTNKVPSKTSHNTLIEVVWTLVPVLILVGVAVPSISLIAKQYEPAPDDAITVKVTGYQWYWGYTYPDNGGFEVISNMMPEADAIAAGLPAQLAVDNRMVVPVGVPIRIQTIGADVIHAFAVPSLWFKLDAVPGRLNEKVMMVNEPGIYYGQCSELCGIKHGYMPIAVEAVPMEQYRAWVASKGGTFGDEEEAAAEPAADEAAADADAPAEGDATEAAAEAPVV